MLGRGFGPYPGSPQGPPFRIFLFPPSGPGLTSRSSTDTNSFSTASMAADPAMLTTQTLLCHLLHGPLTGAESHFRRPTEAGSPSATESQSLHVAAASPPPPRPPRRRRGAAGISDAHAPTGPSPSPTTRRPQAGPDLSSSQSSRVPCVCLRLRRLPH